MRHLCLMLMAGLSLCVPSLHAAPAGDSRRAIQAAYASVEAAVARRDVAGVMTLCAPGYVSEDIDGQFSGPAQKRRETAQLFTHTRTVSITFTPISFTLDSPDRATVTERFRTVAILPTTDRSGEPVKSVLSGTLRDVWIKTALGWRVKLDESLTQTSTINGRPSASL